MSTKIYAHRGSMGKYPQNTMLAFTKGLEEGAVGIETDVQLTADGGLVLLHDEDLSHTTTGTGMVKDHTLADLQALTTGGHPIPTLQNLLNHIKDHDIALNLELKTALVAYDGIESAVLNAVRAANPRGKVIYSSFHLPTLLRIKALEPTAHVAFLLAQHISHPSDYLATLGLEALHIDKDIVLQYPQHYAPLADKIRVWTVNEPDEIATFKTMGVAAIMTDFPERG